MFGEIDLLGAFMPTVVAWFVIALLVFVIADSVLARVGLYRLFWHAPLARFALFVCLFCGGRLIASIL
jgi:protein AaeX